MFKKIEDYLIGCKQLVRQISANQKKNPEKPGFLKSVFKKRKKICW